MPERRPRGRPPKRRPNFILEVRVYLNDIKDIDDQFISAIRQEINLNEVFITRKEEADLRLSLKLRRKGIITTLGRPFQASQKQEIDALIIRDVFDFVPYDPQRHKGRIFNLRLVNKVKGKATESLYEKSRLVIQAYNDEGKEVILT